MSTHSLYAVMKVSGENADQYFAGFDTGVGVARFVASPFDAKLFSNKYEIRLRPDEEIVELVVDLSEANTTVSESFRPKMRLNKK